MKWNCRLNCEMGAKCKNERRSPEAEKCKGMKMNQRAKSNYAEGGLDANAHISLVHTHWQEETSHSHRWEGSSLLKGFFLPYKVLTAWGELMDII